MTPTDDNTAISILKTIAQARLQPASGELALNPDLRAALAAAFDESPQTTLSEGELARAALTLLAQDPTFAEPIDLMASQTGTSARNQRYFEPSTIALTTAILLVLQTRVKFKRDTNRKWSVEIDKKSASDSIIKLLVGRLLSFSGK